MAHVFTKKNYVNACVRIENIPVHITNVEIKYEIIQQRMGFVEIEIKVSILSDEHEKNAYCVIFSVTQLMLIPFKWSKVIYILVKKLGIIGIIASPSKAIRIVLSFDC